MKHEEASLQTRKALSAALKAQMEYKPLRKITVNDLIGMCDLNRKTFYYHFTDIYDLLKWTLEQEAVEVVKQFDLLTNYHDALLFVMNYVEENAHILSCAYDSMGRDELKRFFCSDFYELADGMIDRCCANCGVTIPPDYHRFLRDFYTEAFAGILVNWFRESHTPEEKENTIAYLSQFVMTSLPAVLRQNGK